MKWLLKYFKKKFVIDGTKELFKIAYEHGLEKAGYKYYEAIPMWDYGVFHNAINQLKIKHLNQ